MPTIRVTSCPDIHLHHITPFLSVTYKLSGTHFCPSDKPSPEFCPFGALTFVLMRGQRGLRFSLAMWERTWYNSTHMKEIDELRAQIDHVDAQIVALLKERMHVVHRIGEKKAKSGAKLFVPERESIQRAKLTELNAGVLPEEALLSIYRQIISCGYLSEGGLRIGYLGPEGTWSHQAALARFGDSVSLFPFPSFSHVFEAVERGEVEYAVVPIENNTAGFVTQTMDLLVAGSSVRICAQCMQSIQNCLLAAIPRENIRIIYSHPQVLGQCSRWLQQKLPHAEQISTASTAAAAQMARQESSNGAAALGSRLVAKLYNLEVLDANIQDNASNTTRFAVIGKHFSQPSQKDRTTICFGVPHVPGSLADVLLLFKKYAINIYCIDSRPSRNISWEYLFYIDVEGHELVPPLKNCLEELKRAGSMLKVLGSYPE